MTDKKQPRDNLGRFASYEADARPAKRVTKDPGYLQTAGAIKLPEGGWPERRKKSDEEIITGIPGPQYARPKTKAEKPAQATPSTGVKIKIAIPEIKNEPLNLIANNKLKATAGAIASLFMAFGFAAASRNLDAAPLESLLRSDKATELNVETTPPALSENFAFSTTTEEHIPAETAPAEIIVDDLETPEETAEETSAPRTSSAFSSGIEGMYIPDNVMAAFENAHARTGFPIEVLINVCARESSCRPDAMNSSGAVGLFQFMTNSTQTLFEVVYKYGKDNGYAREADMVEEYTKRRDSRGRAILGYRPVNNAARNHLIEMAKTPQFNTDMYVAYKMPLIKSYNEWLGNRTAASGEYVLLNNIGLGNMKRFMEKVFEDAKYKNDSNHRQRMANAVLGRAICRANQTLCRTGTQNLTVRQAYAKIANNFGGYESVPQNFAQNEIEMALR